MPFIVKRYYSILNKTGKKYYHIVRTDNVKYLGSIYTSEKEARKVAIKLNNKTHHEYDKEGNRKQRKEFGGMFQD